MKKRTWMTLHRWIGLVSVLPFIGLVITGLVLVVLAPITSQQQITANQQRLVLPHVVNAIERLTADQPEASITMLLPGAKATDDWRVQLTDRSTLWFTPYSGEVKNESRDGRFHSWWLHVHNTLLLGHYGPYFVLIFAFCILALAMSGLCTQSNLYRPVVAKPKLTSFRYWHRWFSVVFSIFLLISCASGVLLVGYKLALQRHHDKPTAGIQQPPQASSMINIKPIVATLLEQPQTRVVQGVMVSHSEPQIVTVMMLDREAVWWNKSIALSFDAKTGKQHVSQPSSVFWNVMVAIKAIHIGIWGSTATAWLYLFFATVMLFSIGTGLVLWGQRCWRVNNRYLNSSM